MKQKFLLGVISLLFFTWFTARAQESEPNDLYTQANTLALNGNNSGAINVSGDVDWWAVTTNADGKLNITITISNSLYMWCQIIDNDGTTVISQANTNSTTTFSADGLATGTYYLKCYAFNLGELPAYTISNTLDLPAFSNDSEPNDTKANAKVLGLNNSKNGHIGYYYNNKRDTFDWYKVTTTDDGRLALKLQSGNGSFIRAYLFDKDGTTQLADGNTNSSAWVINQDGLAAGTYYIRINAYYNNEFVPYKLSDSLYTPAFSNDNEPNDTKTNALVLELNDSTTGHAGYYYNNKRDTLDWYKVTTNEDGRLALKLESGNGLYIRAYLFDKDGTTQLADGYTNGSAWVINQDGLAAGTYYIRINAYYNTEFVPYKLSDSLYTPNQANDPGPNDTKNDAIVFPVNTTITGHVGYYYNNKRDTADWYQVTLPDDGNLNLNFSSFNGLYINLYFYDHDGITLLNNSNTNGNTNYNVDGLQKGTYYLRVFAYYDNEFMPYSITSTLNLYGNATDTIINDAPYQAPTMKANQATTGHVGFYYNGLRDAQDWYKINYTGAGDLKLKMTQDPHISDASLKYFWVYVYSDTASSPIASQNSSSAAWEMNLSSLSQGYYYIKVKAYYSTEFVSYNIVDSFEQVTKVRIKLLSDTINNNCASGEIVYKFFRVSGPYSIALYRYGSVFQDYTLSILNNGNKYKYTDLPPGIYYAKGYGDGATGSAFGKSKTDTIIPVPNNLRTKYIGVTKATLYWQAIECLKYYKIRYRIVGNPSWTEFNTSDNNNNYKLTGLVANTNYEWQIASVDTSTSGSYVIVSPYSASVQFTTDAPAFSNFSNGNNKSIQDESIEGLKTYPNPAQNQFRIQFSNKVSGTANIFLKTTTGTVVWNKIHADASSIHNTTVDVSNIPNGMYLLQIILEDGTVYNSKVVISR